jgi:hypothetical protein
MNFLTSYFKNLQFFQNFNKICENFQFYSECITSSTKNLELWNFDSKWSVNWKPDFTVIGPEFMVVESIPRSRSVTKHGHYRAWHPYDASHARDRMAMSWPIPAWDSQGDLLGLGLRLPPPSFCSSPARLLRRSACLRAVPSSGARPHSPSPFSSRTLHFFSLCLCFLRWASNPVGHLRRESQLGVSFGV